VREENFKRRRCCFPLAFFYCPCLMAVGMVSMGLEKFFCGESSTFQFAFLALFGFLDGVSGSVYFHFVVPFCMVCGAVQHGLWCALPMLA